MDTNCGFKKDDHVLVGGSVGLVTGVGVRHEHGSALPVVVVECHDYTRLPMRFVGKDTYKLFPLHDLDDVM